jgi:hypothetical protein
MNGWSAVLRLLGVVIGVNSLHAALKFFEVTYNNLTDSMPAFVELCGKHLKEQQQEKSEQGEV